MSTIAKYHDKIWNALYGEGYVSSQEVFDNVFIDFLFNLPVQQTVNYILVNFSFDLFIIAIASLIYCFITIIDYFVLSNITITPTNKIYLTFAKNSVNNIHDFGLLTLILLSLLVANLFSLFYFIPVQYNSFLVWVLILLVFITIILPVYILKNYGSYYLSYLRGAGLSNLLLKEIFDDFVSVLSFFLRINIQLIRVLIATIFFAVVCDYWEHTGAVSYNMMLEGNLVTFLDYLSFGSTYIWFVLFRLLYEVGHFWILFFIQTNAFSMILVMLVQFLYVCYLIERLESFFIIRKRTDKLSN